jgi:hypothetical protein
MNMASPKVDGPAPIAVGSQVEKPDGEQTGEIKGGINGCTVTDETGKPGCCSKFFSGVKALIVAVSLAVFSLTAVPLFFASYRSALKEAWVGKKVEQKNPEEGSTDKKTDKVAKNELPAASSTAPSSSSSAAPAHQPAGDPK